MDPSYTAPPMADGTPADAAEAACAGDCTSQSQLVGNALYNPFATTGTLLQAPATPQVIVAPPSLGDWGLPVTVTLAGLALIGRMLREMVR